MRIRNLYGVARRATIGLVFIALFDGDAHAAKICIDPGHGGKDPGAVGCGLHESNVVLDVGLRLRDLLVAEGLDVCMTRDTDDFVTLAGRAEYANANGADRFVSLHCNAASVVASGIETYCYSGSGPANDGYKLRNAIQREMLEAWPLADRGGKSASFYVLKYTSMPATLSEMGFINNCSLDATYQSAPAHRSAAATAHLEALRSHLGLPPPDPPPPPPTTTEPPDDPIQRRGTGIVEGYVYEDRGDGDTDVRLPGAEISALETGRAVVAEPGDAGWRFELQPGRYTFVAGLAGYEPGERHCEAVPGYVLSCAIGLRRLGESAELSEVSVAPSGAARPAPKADPEASSGCALGGRVANATPVLRSRPLRRAARDRRPRRRAR